MSNIERYEHHGTDVAVQSELKGKHREHCLCYQDCDRFVVANNSQAVVVRNLEREIKALLEYAEKGSTCPRATLLYAFCRAMNMTTPVWECPDFKEQGEPDAGSNS